MEHSPHNNGVIRSVSIDPLTKELVQKITVFRNNCDNGHWALVDPTTGETQQGTAYDMIVHYLPEGLCIEDCRELRYSFIPHDPADIHGHNVPGTVRIKYTRKPK